MKTTGSKYEATKGLDIAVIAKMVRADIKAALADGSLPAGTTCAVRISRYAGGRSLYVTVTEFAGEIETEAAVLYYSKPDYSAERPRVTETALARATIAKLEEIRASYNYDHSDYQSDYYSVRFYGEAKFSHECVEASRKVTIARKAQETRAAATVAESAAEASRARVAELDNLIAAAHARYVAALAKIDRAHFESAVSRAELAACAGFFLGNA